MLRKTMLILISLAFALAACSSPTPTETPAQPEPYPAPTQPEQPADISYPQPPGPDTPVSAPPAAYPSTGEPGEYDPVPADENLNRGEAFVEMAESQIQVMESFPVQVSVSLKGSLPTPCHQLRVVVPKTDSQNRILLQVYSVVDPNQICAQVLEPFEAQIPIGSFSKAKYSIWVNGELLGEFDS